MSLNRRSDIKGLTSQIRDNTNSIDKKLVDTTFGELRVANRTNLIDIKSVFGISLLRDKITETDGGAITNTLNVDSEYNLTTGITGTGRAILETRSRGRYVAGIEAELGVAVRIPNTSITGNGYYQWGYYDNDDGYFFRLNSSGLNVGVRKGGSDTLIPSSEFNINKNLNNLDDKRVVLDYAKGNIFNVSMTWYGYGSIIFITNIENNPYKLHSFKPTGTSTNNPNLPIRCEAFNNGGTQALSMFVAGRQFSHLGSYTPNFRLTPIYRGGVSVPTTNVGSTDNYTPIMSIRRKNQFTVAPISIDKIEIICDNDCILSVFADTTLDGNESFIALPNINASETSVEYDIGALDFTGAGIVLVSTLVLGGTGGGNSVNLTSPDIKSIDLSGSDIVSVAMKSLSTTATASVLFTIKEEF